MTEPLIVTAKAASKVWELIQEENNSNLKLRVYVTGGGCSGFQYGFKFDEVVNTDDSVVETKIESNPTVVVKLLIDSISLQYLIGSEIDYQEEKELEPAQFIIRNPNAKTTCGCGSSFSA